MLGRRDQRGLFNADNLYTDFVGTNTFYAHLAKAKLFADDDFKYLYCEDNGRKSVAPSLLAKALLLQAHDKISDAEAVAKASFDLRWKVALGLDVDEVPFAKSTLQLFRSLLIINKRAHDLFLASIIEAKKQGYLKHKKRTVAIDTTPIFGAAAVKDTFNLLRDGIYATIVQIAKIENRKPKDVAGEHHLLRYFASSLKGTAAIDWSDKTKREAFLSEIVADAGRVLRLAQEYQEKLQSSDQDGQPLARAAELLTKLLVQDIKVDDHGNASIKPGIAKDRIVSVIDPDMRHGKKSKKVRFDGHKAQVVADVDEKLIVGVDVIAANEHDSTGALEIIEKSQENTGSEVELAIGDCAYGNISTRLDFKDSGIDLSAGVPSVKNRGLFPKTVFSTNKSQTALTCPAGEITTKYYNKTFMRGRHKLRAKIFHFDTEVCQGCARRANCTTADFRTVRINEYDHLINQARHYQQSESGRQERKQRQTIEHRLARLIQLGMRKSRFIGRVKTCFQLQITAAVANLTLIWNNSAGNNSINSLIKLLLSAINILITACRLKTSKTLTYSFNTQQLVIA